ncbi:MAG TPA: serine hydrolase [Actinomycetales bacterium]|nr:serine hydrolase [Actinomycetales bacterium]
MTTLPRHRRFTDVALLAAAATLLGTVAAPPGAAAAPSTTTTTTGPEATRAATTTPPGATVVGGPRLAAPGVVVDLPPGVPRPPAMKAGSYVLADLDRGTVLVAKAAHARWLPASALKSLTALTVLPRVRPDAVVRAEPGDAVEGSKVGLAPGSSYTVRQLLQGMMLSSGNDAATALARAAGGVQLTVARMQAEAIALGARDTVVRNPSGLDAPGQVTSSYDLALFARAGMRVPAFRQLVATRYVDFPGKEVRGKRRGRYQIQNHNRLLANYDGAIGVKNGYTVAARWSVVGAASRGGRTYLVAALRRGDGSWRPTAALLDWAFAHGAQARPVGRLVNRGEVAATARPATPTQPTPSRTPPAVQAEATAGATGAGTQPSAASADPRKGSGLPTGVTVGLVLVALAGAMAAVVRRRRLIAARRARRASRPRG